jgi:AraC-like DNA-binding protein
MSYFNQAFRRRYGATPRRARAGAAQQLSKLFPEC